MSTNSASKAKIVAVTQQKGGTGKTTTVCNLAASFARAGTGLRVVVIDLDPQAAASNQLTDHALSDAGAYDVLVAGQVPRSAVQTSRIKNCLLIPATERLVMAEMDAATRSLSFDDIDSRLRENLAGTDLIILDCPAGCGTISSMAISIADLILAPTPPLTWEIQALQQTLEHAERLRPDARRHFALAICRMDPRSPVQRRIAANLRQDWQDSLLATEIPHDPAVEEAAVAGEVVVEFKPASAAARAYRNLAVELGARLGFDLGPMEEIGEDARNDNMVGQEDLESVPMTGTDGAASTAPSAYSPASEAEPALDATPVQPTHLPDRPLPDVLRGLAGDEPEPRVDSSPPATEDDPSDTSTTESEIAAEADENLGDEAVTEDQPLSPPEPRYMTPPESENDDDETGGEQRPLGTVAKLLLAVALVLVAAGATAIVMMDIGYLPWVLTVVFVLLIGIVPRLLFRLF